MHTELKEWLVTVVSPSRVSLIEEAFEAMVSLSDHQLDEIALNVANYIGELDTVGVLSQLNSDLIRYPEEVLSQYGIFINIETAELETLPTLVNIMNTVRALDVWDEPDELLNLYGEFNSSRELFAEFCHVVTGCDPEDVLPLLLRVESTFITAVELELKRIQRVDRLIADITPAQLTNTALFELITNLPAEHPVRQYIEITGGHQMPWSHLNELKEQLAEVEINATSVLGWYCLARLSGYEEPKAIRQLLGLTLELYTEDLTKIQTFTKLLNTLLSEQTHADSD